jgi:hypothetical protein
MHLSHNLRLFPDPLKFNDGLEEVLHSYVLSQPREALENNPAAILSVINTFVKTKTMMMILHEHKLKVVPWFT